jgi:mRNA interferase RelE/StbE
MSYQISYHPDVQKDLADLPKNIKDRIQRAIEERLMKDPVKYGNPLRKSLRGYRKLRVGDYRIIYRIEERNIFVFKIGHRKEIYTKDLGRN